MRPHIERRLFASAQFIRPHPDFAATAVFFSDHAPNARMLTIVSAEFEVTHPHLGEVCRDRTARRQSERSDRCNHLTLYRARLQATRDRRWRRSAPGTPC